MPYPNWLTRSSLASSLVFAAMTWVLLVLVQANSGENSPLHDATTAVLMPGFHAGIYVGAHVFPDHAVRGTTGWYVVPLFGIFGQFLLLFTFWYVLISLKRAFQGEQETVPSDESTEPHRNKRVSSQFNGEVEPTFTPGANYGRISYLFHYERFKFGIWREFRDHTGNWPLFSICFHCGALLGIFVSIIVFFSAKENQNWDDWHSFLIGATSAVAYVVFVVIGEKVMRKLDWRLFGRRNS